MFRIRYKFYEYLIMSFGLTNAPAIEQELMNDMFRDIFDDYIISYLDDTLIYSSGTLEDHQQKVKEVLKRFSERELYLKPEKCAFHQTEIEFLEHLVGRDGIKIDPKKISSILEWPTLENVKNVQSFLGFVNFNRQFIKNYSHIAEPLTRLTRKDLIFNWTQDQEKAFNQLKRLTASAPVLQFYDPEKPVRIETDASG